MAKNTDFRYELAAAAADAISPLVDAGTGGVIVIFQGTQPASCDDADAGIKLAELPMSSTAFAAATDVANAARIAAQTISNETEADATGTAQYFRVYSTAVAQNHANKSVCYIQGSVGTSDADFIIDSVAIAAGGTVSISTYYISIPYLTV
jgi:hypothetical protein